MIWLAAISACIEILLALKISGDECEMMQVFKMIISIYLVGFCNSQEQFRGDI